MANKNDVNLFSAKEPSLGYHYQIRYALYLLFQSKDKEDPFVKLENLDDVEVEYLNKKELYQTKFHNNKAANLSDSSVDIWKTIRVWSEMITNNEIDLENVIFVLVTTSDTSKNSILQKLKDRNIIPLDTEKIVKTLDEISQTSSNKSLTSSFTSYNKLAINLKEKLIDCIHIKDNALTFEALEAKIKLELQYTFMPQHIESAYNTLEGWWYKQCIEHLSNKKEYISLSELRKYILFLNHKYQYDNLLIDKQIRKVMIDTANFDDRLFVKQLKEIKCSDVVLTQAKKDYYRAKEQRSKWVRESLLNTEEEIEYEENLKDDWERKFVYLKEEIDGEEDTDIIAECCKTFYQKFYGEDCPKIYIRDKVRESFIIIGSCQILVEQQDMVWHTNYLTK